MCSSLSTRHSRPRRPKPTGRGLSACAARAAGRVRRRQPRRPRASSCRLGRTEPTASANLGRERLVKVASFRPLQLQSYHTIVPALFSRCHTTAPGYSFPSRTGGGLTTWSVGVTRFRYKRYRSTVFPSLLIVGPSLSAWALDTAHDRQDRAAKTPRE